MKKPYLILVNGKLWDRKLTRAGALKIVTALRDKGLPAVLAYECVTGSREVMTEEGASYEPHIR